MKITMFTISKTCDMLEMWHLNMRNGNKARLLYQQKYPERRIPNGCNFGESKINYIE